MINDIKRYKKQGCDINRIHTLLNSSSKEVITIHQIKMCIVKYYYSRKHTYKPSDFEQCVKDDAGYSLKSIMKFKREVEYRNSKPPKRWQELQNPKTIWQKIKKTLSLSH